MTSLGTDSCASSLSSNKPLPENHYQRTITREQQDHIIFHIALHFALPLLIAGLFYRPLWIKASGLLLLGLVIDVDHLFATPIYDPSRCSIGFHPLHTILPIVIYVAMLFPKKTRIIGIGLCIHIALDMIDCELNGTGLCLEEFLP